MTTLDLHSTTVGELVRQQPARSRVFEALRIDYCCGGKTPLAEACAARGLDPEDVARQLREVDGKGDYPAIVDVDAMGLAELADHIEQTHHAALRQDLPRLDFLTRKVATVHGDAEPRLRDIRTAFIVFHDELLQHMNREERMLFPLIRQLEDAGDDVTLSRESLKRRIATLEAEHEHSGEALACFRELTDNYTPPDWACNTFRALYDALAWLERDMHQHVHKENNILFPKALTREAELFESEQS